MTDKSARSTLTDKFEDEVRADSDLIINELSFMMDQLSRVVRTRETAAIQPGHVPLEMIANPGFLVTLSSTPNYCVSVRPEGHIHTKVSDLDETGFVGAGFDGKGDFLAKTGASEDADITVLIYDPAKIVLLERMENGVPRLIGHGAPFHKPKCKLH